MAILCLPFILTSLRSSQHLTWTIKPTKEKSNSRCWPWSIETTVKNSENLFELNYKMTNYHLCKAFKSFMKKMIMNLVLVADNLFFFQNNVFLSLIFTNSSSNVSILNTFNVLMQVFSSECKQLKGELPNSLHRDVCNTTTHMPEKCRFVKGTQE